MAKRDGHNKERPQAVGDQPQLCRFVARMPGAVAMLDRNMRYLAVSKQWLEEYRLEERDVVGESHYQLFPDLPESWKVLHRQALEGATLRAEEDSFPRADGTLDWVNWEIWPWNDVRGEIGGILISTEVVTRRKTLEVALRRSEGKLRALVDGAPTAIVSFNNAGTIEWMNAVAATLFRTSVAAVVGQSIDAFLLPREFWLAPPHTSDHGYELVAKRCDGSGFHAHAIVRAIELDDSRVFAAFLGDLSDVDDLHERIHQAQRTEVVAALTSGIAHDYNNLLMGILGCIDAAQRQLDSGSAVGRYLDEARHAAQRGTALTRQLLSFSRPHDVTSTSVEVDAVVRRTTLMIRSLVGEEIDVEVRCGTEGAAVEGDATQVEQVLLNLAINARDAMPHGGRMAITTELGVAPERGYAREVILSVSDNGAGMDDATSARVFDPFFTTKEPGRGTGLGLSTVRDIVSRGGGHIAVSSHVGEGTTLAVHWPVVVGSVSTIAPKHNATIPPVSSTILIVEDDPLVRMTVAGYLQPHGFNVLRASDGCDVTTLLDKHDGDIDVLLSDVMLPGTVGRVVADEVRALHPRVATIFMSAHSRDLLLAGGQVPASVPSLQKPFSEEELIDAIVDALAARPLAPVAAKAEGGSILLVEDYELSRNLMREGLEEAGYRVVAAGGAAEALALLEDKSATIDLIVTDLGLPDGSGDTLVSRLRQRLGDIPAIYVTGQSGDDPRFRDLMRDPLARFMQKPVSIDSLAEQIEEALRPRT